MTFWEEGTGHAGPVEGATSPPFCSCGGRDLVPGATVLLRLPLCALVLHLQNIPSLQFSSLYRPGCLGEEGSFPTDHRGSQALGGQGIAPTARPGRRWR